MLPLALARARARGCRACPESRFLASNLSGAATDDDMLRRGPFFTSGVLLVIPYSSQGATKHNLGGVRVWRHRLPIHLVRVQ